MTNLLFGADGQIGKALKHKLSSNADEWLFLSKANGDITSNEKIESLFNSNKPKICINAAAFTKVDDAEFRKEEATNINAVGPYILAKNCSKYKTKLIHLSTDYVFDGTAAIPYSEDSVPAPLSVYGKSKLIGEQLAQMVNDSTVILRTSWVFANEGKCFPSKIIELAKSQDRLSVINDQFGKPTFAGDIADVILNMVRSENITAGIYHYAGEPSTTWFEFAEFLVQKAFMDKKLESLPAIYPIRSRDFPSSAERPRYSVLDTTKLEKILGVKGKCWKSCF